MNPNALKTMHEVATRFVEIGALQRGYEHELLASLIEAYELGLSMERKRADDLAAQLEVATFPRELVCLGLP